MSGFLGGEENFNAIREHDEKRGGRRRLDSNFRIFNSFINNMEMEDVNLVGSMYTWANNK